MTTTPSRMISDPLQLFDYCLESDGAVAFVVTSAERARDLPQKPVYIGGVGYGPGRTIHAKEWDELTECGGKFIAPRLYGMAGVTPNDIDVALLYDAFTYMLLVQLEDYGFCAKGEGGPFAASGALALDGALPTNPPRWPSLRRLPPWLLPRPRSRRAAARRRRSEAGGGRGSGPGDRRSRRLRPWLGPLSATRSSSTPSAPREPRHGVLEAQTPNRIPTQSPSGTALREHKTDGAAFATDCARYLWAPKPFCNWCHRPDVLMGRGRSARRAWHLDRPASRRRPRLRRRSAVHHRRRRVGDRPRLQDHRQPARRRPPPVSASACP